MTKPLLFVAILAATVAAPIAAHADGASAAEIRTRIDFDAVKGLLAVQRLDGWLLSDYQGQNPIAQELVNPDGRQTRRWFYYIPADGQPVALIHKVDASNFARVPGRKLEYVGWRELDRQLAEMLKGAKRVAMEYSPKGAIPELSRVDAGTLERVRSAGVKISPSAELVQFTKSVWGEDGREAHYVAAHHLVALRDDAYALVAKRVRDGRRLTEYELQQHIYSQYAKRGLVGEPPIVAVNANAADPQYRPTQRDAATIREGDLLLIDMWGKSADHERGIYAELTWVAYVGADVPDRYQRAFAAVVEARDAAVAYIDEKVKRRRPVRGFEADQRARRVISQAGFGEKFVHRTGHSIDTDLHGAGANLDDYETHDTRTLVRGAGFTVEPGVYVPGDFGVRAEVTVYIGKRGVELTTPVQKTISAILAR